MRLLPYFGFLTILLACLSSACTSNRFYTPNSMQIPMLTEKGQATVTLAGAKGSNIQGWEAQAIYSPLPHLGILVNHFDLQYSGNTYTEFSPFSSFSAETEFEGKTRLTEAGVGGYIQAGPKAEYLLSMFAGYGKGHTRNSYLPNLDLQITETYNSSWNYQRWFLQSGLGMKYRRFQVGTGIRLVWVDYLDGSINTRIGLTETQRIELLETASPLFLAELGWTIGWYFKPIVISLNTAAVVQGKSNVRELDLASNFVSLSVGLNLHELKKKAK